MFGIGDKVIVTSVDCSENIGVIIRGPVSTYNDGWYYYVYARNTSIYISETSIQLQQRINWDEKPGVKEYILRVYEEPELAPTKPYDPFDNNSIIKPTDKTT